jgi:hypothetical protein
MKREILCVICGAQRSARLHPDDAAAGFDQRSTLIEAVKVPKGHGLTVNGDFSPMKNIRCDRCDSVIDDGSPAVALTMWNTNREAEPRLWETEYANQA